MIRVRELFKTKWFRVSKRMLTQDSLSDFESEAIQNSQWVNSFCKKVQEKLFDAYLIYGEINFAKYNKETARF